jgi:cyclase
MGRQVLPVLVTTVQFRSEIMAGDPVSQAKIYEAQLADELIVLNIDGTPIADDLVMLGLITRLATETFMPLAVGGGVRTVDDFALLLDSGADKVTINVAALDRPQLIDEAAKRFGTQCVVVSIDFRTTEGGESIVCRDRASVFTGRSVRAWAQEVTSRGAGELLLSDADRDGMGTGLHSELSREIAGTIPIPVILSGGCGRAEHFVEGFLRGGAEGVAAGTFFCFRDQNPMQARAHVQNAGIPIRMET